MCGVVAPRQRKTVAHFTQSRTSIAAMSSKIPDPRGPDAPSAPADLARIAELEGQVARLSDEVERWKALADHDTLTPALNRRAFVHELARTIAYCRRHGVSAAVLYLDLDGFKAVNDAYGHPAGDAALIQVAQLLNAQVRESDIVARLGGDEFAVLLLNADQMAGTVKAQSLTEALEAFEFRHEGHGFRLGGSFGVRAFEGQTEAEAWLAEADAAMFVRKHGR